MAHFPAGFLWGAATAGHQVEGGNVNADLWPMEWAAESLFTEPSGDACDHYHRYPEDIGIMADLGFTAYRFSLEWARIEPEPGYFSRAALDHYRRMIGTCLERGITPVVTYCHFSTPRWFAGLGGWGHSQAADRFGRFAGRATEHLGDLLSWVGTLNEPNVMTMLEHTGVMPMGTSKQGVQALEAAGTVSSSAPAGGGSPGGTCGIGGYDPSTYRMGLMGADIERMSAIHRRAVEAIKSGPGNARVGWTLALVDLQPADGGESRWEQARARAQLDWLEISRDDDFVGVQTYSRNRIGPDGQLPVPEGVPTMQTGWEVYPDALEHTVRLAATHARVPLLVTENGMATDDDAARIDYTRAALGGLARCLEEGIDVRGYPHWTLLDNFEWTAGFAKTFGLIAVDRDTLARTVKPSARWLGQVARTGTLS